MKIPGRVFFLTLAAILVYGQSDSARYLWNAGNYRHGDLFFRSDCVDTLFMGNRQILALSDAETTIVLPRSDIASYEDSGGIKIYPKFSTIQWNLPKSWEAQPGEYSFATIGIAPDEFQMSIEGNSERNRDICLYARRNINLGIRLSSLESYDDKIQMIEQFSYGMGNEYERIPFTLWCDRMAYGYGLAKFFDLRPSYSTMGHIRDSVVIINVRLDTLFGAYGEPGSGYAKILRAQLLDTVKFDIDISGAYRIAGGTEIRPRAVEADTVYVRYLVSGGERFADRIYIDMTSGLRYAKYIPGLNADYGCVITLSGDDEEFVMVKGICKKDSLIIRTSAGYAGYINYLLFIGDNAAWDEKFSQKSPAHSAHLEIWPTVTGKSTRLRYALNERQHIRIRIYDAAGRVAFDCLEGNREAGFYSDEIDLSSLSGGVYFIGLETGMTNDRGKIVIVK